MSAYTSIRSHLSYPLSRKVKSPFLSPKQKRRNQSMPACMHIAYMRAYLCGSHPAACISAAAVPQRLYLSCGRSLPVRQPLQVDATRPKREGTTCEAGIGGGEGGGDAAVGSGEPGGLACPPQRELSVAVRSWTAVGLRRQPAVGGRGQGARRGQTWRRTAARRRLISWL